MANPPLTERKPRTAERTFFAVLTGPRSLDPASRFGASSRHLVRTCVDVLQLKPEPASGKVWAQDAAGGVDDPVKEDSVEASVIGEVLEVPDVVDCASRVQVSD